MMGLPSAETIDKFLDAAKGIESELKKFNESQEKILNAVLDVRDEIRKKLS